MIENKILTYKDRSNEKIFKDIVPIVIAHSHLYKIYTVREYNELLSTLLKILDSKANSNYSKHYINAMKPINCERMIVLLPLFASNRLFSSDEALELLDTVKLLANLQTDDDKKRATDKALNIISERFGFYQFGKSHHKQYYGTKEAFKRSPIDVTNALLKESDPIKEDELSYDADAIEPSQADELQVIARLSEHSVLGEAELFKKMENYHQDESGKVRSSTFKKLIAHMIDNQFIQMQSNGLITLYRDTPSKAQRAAMQYGFTF